MLEFLRPLSGFFFYLLGSSFVVAYVLLRNSIGGVWAAWWLQVGDLPLILSATIYGGMNLYRSVSNNKPSPVLKMVLTIILTLLVLFCVALNFAHLWW